MSKKTTITLLIATFIIFMLPGLVMVWGGIFGMTFSNDAVGAAIFPFIIGVIINAILLAEGDL